MRWAAVSLCEEGPERKTAQHSCHTLQDRLEALCPPPEGGIMQGHPAVFVLPQEAVSSGCCHIIESLQVSLPDGKDERIIIPERENKQQKKKTPTDLLL